MGFSGSHLLPERLLAAGRFRFGFQVVHRSDYLALFVELPFQRRLKRVIGIYDASSHNFRDNAGHASRQGSDNSRRYGSISDYARCRE
jgi:hypothetical protein